MPFINLIQEQRLAAKKNEQTTRIFFFAFVGAAVMSVGAFGFFMFQADQLKGEEAELNAKTQHLLPLSNEIKDKKKEYDQLAPRLQTLQDAQDITSRWGRVLAHLAQQTPEQTWLTAIKCTASDPKAPISIAFDGMSAKQELIGEFILRLQGCPDLVDVGFKYSNEKTVGTTSDLEFEINANLDGTVDKKADTIKKESS